MLTKQQALDIARAQLASGDDILENRTEESDTAWLFTFGQKDRRNVTLGGGGLCLVHKVDGKAHLFNTHPMYADALRVCELGYLKYEHWVIEVTSVQDEAVAVKYLSRLELESVVREGSHGVYVTTRTRLPDERLGQSLKNLPARFYLHDVWRIWKILESFKDQTAFIYRLAEHDWDAKCV
jgi:hypothetical protein